MGRTGKMFAMEHFGVTPDMTALAKGIASGMPLGALVARADIMDWEAGSHASTFGGNPLSCQAALATIKLIQEKLMDNAALQGNYFKNSLLELQKSHECMGDVRGLGLMIAVELVRDRNSKKPDKSLRDKIIQNSFKKGLLLLGCGENSIRFCPALSVSSEEIDTCLDIFEEAVKEATR
jgi:4-aminobutyrate aminotransferase